MKSRHHNKTWICLFTAALSASLLTTISFPVAAQDNPSASDKQTIAAELDFSPPWDWIQLNTGEWLKGELLGMDRAELSFDSEKLGKNTWDWFDIRSIYTNRPMAVLLRNFDTAVGKLETKDGQLYIKEQDLYIPFQTVLGIAAGTGKALDMWNGDISLSANIRRGNTIQDDVTISAYLNRRTAKSNMRATFVSNYSKIQSQLNADEQRGNFVYDYRFKRKWFWRPVFAEYYRDPFQNIDQQWTFAMGAGYYLFETNKVTWTVSSGPGYQKTRYANTAADGDRSRSSAALFLGTDFDQSLTNDIDLRFAYQVIFTDSDAGKAKHHAVLSLDVDLTDSLDLRISAYWDRIAEPQADNMGVVPLSNDYRYTLGLSYDF